MKAILLLIVVFVFYLYMLAYDNSRFQHAFNLPGLPRCAATSGESSEVAYIGGTYNDIRQGGFICKVNASHIVRSINTFGSVKCMYSSSDGITAVVSDELGSWLVKYNEETLLQIDKTNISAVDQPLAITVSSTTYIVDGISSVQSVWNGKVSKVDNIYSNHFAGNKLARLRHFPDRGAIEILYDNGVIIYYDLRSCAFTLSGKSLHKSRDIEGDFNQTRFIEALKSYASTYASTHKAVAHNETVWIVEPYNRLLHIDTSGTKSYIRLFNLFNDITYIYILNNNLYAVKGNGRVYLFR